MNEKLEIIKLLKGQTLEDMYAINIILIHLNEMVDKGIITRKDIDNIDKLPEFKKKKIIEYVSSKVNEHKKRSENRYEKNNNKGNVRHNSTFEVKKRNKR